MAAPIEEFADRRRVPAWARTADWDQVPAQLRRRAFFSATIEDARALSAEREAVADLLQRTRRGDGRLPRRDIAIRELQSLMQQRGLDTGAPDALTNPAAPRRIKLVLDTNRAQAQGYARFKRASSGGALLAFPAQELVRVRQSTVRRDWRSRWQSAGGKLYAGRMIALKSAPVWALLSRFGNPYPPFDFGSGMGVRDVSRRDAIALGVIEPEQTQPDPVAADLNTGLESSAAGIYPDFLRTLQSHFGAAVAVRDGKMRFTV